MRTGLLFVLFFLLVSCQGFSAVSTCDFDEDGEITSSDTAIFAAWLQTRKSTDIPTVQERARAFVSTVVVKRLPVSSDKLADIEDAVGSTDLAFLAAYIQTRKSSEFALVESRANAILGLTLKASKLPGTLVGGSTVPVTMTGIQLDPPWRCFAAWAVNSFERIMGGSLRLPPVAILEGIATIFPFFALRLIYLWGQFLADQVALIEERNYFWNKRQCFPGRRVEDLWFL